MELLIKKEIIEKINVELPVYTKSECHNYMVFSDGFKDRCIQICTLKNAEAIGICHAGLAFDSPPEVNSNEQEFKDALMKVLDVIAVKSNLLIRVSELPQPEDYMQPDLK